MANQIVVSAGAKVRNLNGVLTGTTGVVNSLPINAANGIPQLDVNGKILVSQLPNSVMEYQGTWNAATNTPTLVNGTGNQGDVYLCNVAGTVNFGAGPIAFVVGDQVIYSGSIWQRASGATGTVTSVAITESGDSLNITGSPITTSGTINIGFNGTNLQYVNGAGNLTTFPTLITSIGLSMPSAFSVANSPLTANGTIAVTGAGYASQYIRGDGTLADFPSSGGGGSSVSYYLNGGTSQGTIGGTTYYEMSKTADTGTGVDFTKSGDGFIVAFLTDANDPAQLNIPAGNWNYEIYASMSANGGTPEMYAELYKYDGTTFTLIATSPHEILYDGTALNLYTFAMTVPATTLALTDRLAIKLYATNSGGKTTTIHTQDSHLCQVITTFSTGITALNGLTAQVQYFQTGTSGTDFNISSTTATHTFNIPDASATARGLITTGTQTIAGTKTFSSNPIITNSSSAYIGINSATGNSSSVAFSVNNTNVGFISVNASQFAFRNYVSNEFRLVDGTMANGGILAMPSASLQTYTFPAATGTMAMLEGTQTFTGSKTFTGSATFNNTLGNSIILNYGAALVKGNTPSSTSGVWSNIYAAAGNNNLVIADNANISKLQFQAASSYTYTFPAATGTIALTSDLTGGTVTSVAALTIGTTGTDLSSSVANSTTTPVITLNVPTASATNRGVLASADWTTFNNKQSALTNPVTGTGTTNYLPKFTGASTIGNSAITDVSGIIKIGTTASTTYGTLTIVQQSVAAPSFVRGIQLVHPNGTGVTGGYLGISVSGQKQGQIQVGDDSNSGDLIINPAGGNLGLGVTPSAWSGSTGFQVQYATVEGRSSLPSFAEYAANSYSDAGVRKYIASDYASRYTQYQSNHYWFTAPSGTAGAAITFTQAMTLTAAGNLGIGTSTFPYTSSGRGYLSINGSTDSLIEFQIGASSSGYIYSSATGFEMNANGSRAIQFNTNGTEKMRITSGGDALFQFSGNRRIGIDYDTTGAYFYGFATNSNARQTRIICAAADANAGISFETGSSFSGATTKMLITSGGNVLIGTTTDAGYKLQTSTNNFTIAKFVTSASQAQILLQSTDAGGYALYQSKGGGANTWQSGAWPDNSYRIGISGVADYMTITSGGNVGIGTTSPDQKLVIANASGTVYAKLTADFGSAFIGMETADDSLRILTAQSTPIQFYTDNAERMRITSGGALCLGVTSAYGTNLLNVNGGIYATSSIAAVVAADIDMFVFQNTGATYTKAAMVASIAATGGTGSYFFYGQQSTSTVALKIFSNGNIQNTNNSYGAISDARLKENIKDATPKLDDLMKVKVRNYNLKGESNKQLGVISQELEAIFPNMIEESTNMGENMKIKGVKYSVFVPMLIKAVQELKAEIEILKNK